MNKTGNFVRAAALTAALAGSPEAVSAHPPTPEAQQDMAFAMECVDQAANVPEGQTFNSYNPAAVIGSGYRNGSLRQWETTTTMNGISPECAAFVTGRTVSVNQIYRGKVNTKSPHVYKGTGEFPRQNPETGKFESTVLRSVLKRGFSCIRGPKTRGYIEEVTMTVQTDGYGTFKRTGRDVVRGASDGC